MPLLSPRRLLLKHVNVKKKRGFCTSKKCQESGEAETIFTGTNKDTLAKHEPLEKYVKTVTMRAEALATTEADCFKTLIERQEEAQKHLNELSAQLSQQNTALRSTQGKPHSAKRRNKHTPGSQSLLFFPTSCQGQKEWWFDVRPKAVGKNRPCPVEELCSGSSESSSALDATMARWYEAFEKRVTASQSTHRSEWSSPSETKPRQKRIQTFGCRRDARKRNSLPPLCQM